MKPSNTPRSAFPLGTLALALAAATGLALAQAPQAAGTAAPATVSASPSGTASALQSVEAVIEAERQAVLSVPVQGAITELKVRAGDSVRAGQLLLRVDARAAAQGAQAAGAQAEAARATLTLAQRELGRQQQLFQQGFISRAALDQAEAQSKASQAQAQAQLAAAQAAQTQAGWFELRAPFDGVVAALPVTLGDLAQPGRPLATVVDPRQLRASAEVPLRWADAAQQQREAVRVTWPGRADGVVPSRVERLPLVDVAANTVTLRFDLPAGSGALPGQFARVQLPVAGTATTVRVPRSAVLRRGELDLVYVLGAQGKPLLRQVRLGPVTGEQVELLAGVGAGERVVSEPTKLGAAL
jgi:RND family efflux transporter MFP subunit